MMSSELIKKRAVRVIVKYAVIVGIGLLYALFVSVSGIGVPCPLFTLTGLQCPGCGVSRMALALLQWDFASAFRANPVILLTSPTLLFCLLRAEICYIRTGEVCSSRLYRILLCAEAVVLLVFGIVRNINF